MAVNQWRRRPLRRVGTRLCLGHQALGQVPGAGCHDGPAGGGDRWTDRTRAGRRDPRGATRREKRGGRNAAPGFGRAARACACTGDQRLAAASSRAGNRHADSGDLRSHCAGLRFRSHRTARRGGGTRWTAVQAVFASRPRAVSTRPPSLHEGPRRAAGPNGAGHDPFRLNEDNLDYVLGIDIGGTNLVVGAVATADGRVIADCTRPTGVARGAQAIVAELIQLSRDCIARVESGNPGDKVIGIGIGVPGPLDIQRGVVLLTPNLGWTDLPLRDMVSEGIGLPTVLDNDANCAILGECWVGAARDARFAIGLTIGTGIGGVIAFGGCLHLGISDFAGEIGDVTIEMNGRLCGCGNHGCLEAYASGPAIARRAAERMQPGSILASLVDGDSSRITAETVY